MITVTTVAVVFFLAFLGMRLPYLDQSSKKPKPRPRAVLTLSAKSLSGTFSSSKSNYDGSAPLLHLLHAVQIIFPDVNRLNILQCAEPVATLNCRLPKDRSPPSC